MADPTPTPAPDPTLTPDPAPTPTPEPAKDPDDGKGGKDAILADLAKERDKRQALEQQVQDLLPLRDQFAAIAKVFNPGDDTPPDPAALAKQIADEQAKVSTAEDRAVSAERQLAVYRAAGAHEANADALLDSASFLTSLAAIDPTDTDAIGEAIKSAVAKDERFKATPPTPPFPGGPRKPAAAPDPGPGLPRLRDAYAQSSK